MFVGGPNDKVWTLRPDDVIMIGRLFETGKLHSKRIVALTGDCLSIKPTSRFHQDLQSVI